ncbi:MAG: sugar phosphate isomerase/epimerase [Fimbriimonadaceae bacterium]|nr:sugar phosphate isomerase/epimerase [Fimbriimonadaceae bacterium]
MLLKSLNYWSVPGGLEGTLDVFNFLQTAKEHRFDAVEVAIGEAGSAFGTDATEARCKEVLAEAERLGVKVASTASGLYWGRNLADTDAALSAQAADDLKKMLQITQWLGCRTLLTIPGAVDVFFMPERGVNSYDGVWDRATVGIRAALPTAEACGVRMGIENVWNKFLVSPMEMASFIDQFDSPWVGAYVDVGNVLPFGYGEQWLRILGERVVGIHFKDFRKAVGNLDGFVDLLEGDVNWPEVMAAIGEIGYDGPLVAEMIPYYAHYPMVRIANTSNAMDAIMGRGFRS